MRKTRKKKETYFIGLDILRIFACVSIFLYHLGIIKGGYLAVCTFFVMSAFLSCYSGFKKDKFSFKEYYISRIKKIYVPILLTVFTTVLALSFIKSYNWFNMKPEVTSIISGYNNYWQLNANLDYFARHISSPFMHFWYIGILLQFELIFPFLFIFFKKLGDKYGKKVPVISLSALSVISTIYFIYQSIHNNLMFVYYDTFIRSFSIIYGLLLGFLVHYYGKLIKKKIDKNKKLSKRIFIIYMLALVIPFLFVSDKSKILNISMILVSLISCRLICYSLTMKGDNKIVRYISNLAYPIYLFQYPVIFIFSYVKLNIILETILIILITIIIAWISYYALSKQTDKKKVILKYILLILLLGSSSVGVYKYVNAKDYTKEMKQLENELAENEKKMQEAQEAYAAKLKEQEEEWNKTLAELESGEANIEEVVNSLRVVFIGDSVMLGAQANLYKQFPNSYVDAKVSRSIYAGNTILKELKSRNQLGEPIVIGLGTNGGCPKSCKEGIIETAGGRDIFWLTVTNDADVHINDSVKALAEEHSNVHIIDWEVLSKGHEEYFYADKIHLNPVGRKAYTEEIRKAIYDAYVYKYKLQKEETIKKHEQENRTKYSFYGNDLLINLNEYLDYEKGKVIYNGNKDYDMASIKKDLKKAIDDNLLNYNVVFVFDKSIPLTIDDYNELISICKNHYVYIINITSNDFSKLNGDNVKVIEFYNDIKDNKKYLMPDGTHLSTKGNEALCKLIKDSIK
jgi:peptidoglycan/LPS O-acetylase OafA/YrhL/lysophospholipase L1-like esterase